MHTSTSLIQYTDLSELGRGAQVALMGFRAFAFGGTKCCCLVKTYQSLLGKEEGGWALGRLRDLAHHLGNDGSRRLKIAAPGCIRITHDESSILGAISAAQEEDETLMAGHLTWLLAGAPGKGLEKACEDFAGALSLAGLVVSTPESVNAVDAFAPESYGDRPRLVANAAH